MSEWVNITQAVEILGLPRDVIMSKIHNGCVPFRMVGSQYRLNIKIVQVYLIKEDIKNMEAVRNEIDLKPASKQKIKVRKVII